MTAPWLIETLRRPDGAIRYQVARGVGKAKEYRKSASGRASMFRTWREASRVCRLLNEDEATDAQLKAECAGLPPLPSMTFARLGAIARGQL
jgi:hypothetical protein